MPMHRSQGSPSPACAFHSHHMTRKRGREARVLLSQGVASQPAAFPTKKEKGHQRKVQAKRREDLRAETLAVLAKSLHPVHGGVPCAPRHPRAEMSTKSANSGVTGWTETHFFCLFFLILAELAGFLRFFFQQSPGTFFD